MSMSTRASKKRVSGGPGAPERRTYWKGLLVHGQNPCTLFSSFRDRHSPWTGRGSPPWVRGLSRCCSSLIMAAGAEEDDDHDGGERRSEDEVEEGKEGAEQPCNCLLLLGPANPPFLSPNKKICRPLLVDPAPVILRTVRLPGHPLERKSAQSSAVPGGRAEPRHSGLISSVSSARFSNSR